MEELRKELGDFLKKTKAVKTVLGKEGGAQIQKKKLLQQIGEVSKTWFDVLRVKLNPFCDSDTLEKYDTEFKALTQLSLSPGNRKSSYLAHLNKIVTSFNKEIVLGVYTKPQSQDINHAVLDSLIKDISNPEESEYLKEAIACAKSGYIKASVVLGWCAAIDRIHNKIEAMGFTKFNVTAAQMASATSGRFKKFSGIQSVTSLSELREVFDNQILWVLEGMALIDVNQHTRLKSCFDMRNHSAHPGDAPITPYNLMSFFSDINEIIFKNTKFDYIPPPSLP